MADVIAAAANGEAGAPIAVIGCGNSNRSDDGIGPVVIRELATRGLGDDPRVRLLDAGTDGMAVMFAARHCRSLIIIDSCRSGAEPGAIFQLPGAALERQAEPSLTLHDFRWNHALYAGRRLYDAAFPTAVTVFLVEAGSVDFGLELGPPVAAAAVSVADRIEALLRAWLDNAGAPT
jgi:hydrogenase maturation protease